MSFRPLALLATLLGAVVASRGDTMSSEWNADIRAAETAAKNGGYDDSLPPLRKALALAQQFSESDVRLLDTLIRLAKTCTYADGCMNGESKGLVDRALRIRSKVRPVDAHFAIILMQLGGVASDLQKYRDALLCYREALDIREKLFRHSDGSIAQTYANIAWVYHWQGDKAQARRTFQYALELREQAGAAQTAEFAELVDSSAALYSAERDETRAIREYDRAIAIRERLWKPSDGRFTGALLKTANACQYSWPAYAERLYRRILELQKTIHTERSEQYYGALVNLASYYGFKKRVTEAEGVYAEALAIRQKMGRRDMAASECLEQIARCRMRRGLYHEAINPAQEGLAIRRALLPASDRLVIGLYLLLAELYAESGDTRNAERNFAVMINDARFHQPYQLIATAERLGDIYQKHGDYARAAEKYEIAIATLESKAGPDNAQLPGKMIRLAKMYQAMGRMEDANRVSMRASQIMWTEVMKDARRNVPARTFFLGLVAVLAGAALALVALLLFNRSLMKKLDRRLSALYLPPPLPPPSPPNVAPASIVDSEVHSPGDAEAAAMAVAVEEPAAVLRPAEPAQVGRVVLRADGSSLFAIRVVNLLFSLLTLGVYSFWGKARVRRYICGQAEFDDDRFVFHGTGKEMLIGWLRGLPVLGFVVFFPYILPVLWQHRYSLAVAQLSAFGAALLLWPVARAGAHRYRLNRMSWRGIRFSFRGSTWRFLVMSIAGYLTTIVTLGFYLPFFQMRIRRFLLDRAYFGDRAFRFSGRGADILLNYLCAVPLAFMTLGFSWAWWSALRQRYYWDHTTFAGARFRCHVTGGKLLWLWMGNFLIAVPTLGLGMSWVTLRSLRFWTRHIEVIGDLDLATVHQDARAASAMGESFADFLGFDFGF